MISDARCRLSPVSRSTNSAALEAVHVARGLQSGRTCPLCCLHLFLGC